MRMSSNVECRLEKGPKEPYKGQVLEDLNPFNMRPFNTNHTFGFPGLPQIRHVLKTLTALCLQ